MQIAGRWGQRFSALVFLLGGLPLFGCTLASVEKSVDAKDREPTICVLDSGSGNSHQKEVLIALESLLSAEAWSSQRIQSAIKTYPIYEADGSLASANVLRQLNAAAETCDILHLSWNLQRSPRTLEIEERLSQISLNKIVVIAAGATTTGGIEPLRRTVAGQIKNAIIIAEAMEDGRLHPSSYSGGEIAIALPPPKGKAGSSFSSLRVSSALLNSWSQRKPLQWLEWSRSVNEFVRKNGRFPSLERLLEHNLGTRSL